MTREAFIYGLIALVSLVLFVPFLGHVHLFDWDEINFAEAAREMIVTGNYMRVQIDYQPFWEKPPLFIWMQALSMKAFGVNEFAARFPNAVAGLCTLWSLYFIGKKTADQKTAVAWMALYVSSWLPHLYFKSGIIDPWFNLFIFLSLFQFYSLGISQRKWLHSLLGGVFLGLAVMTKGPAAILITGLAIFIFLLWQRRFKRDSFLQLLVFGLACAFTVSIWFGIDAWQHGWWFLREFITYQIRLFNTEDAGHGGPFFYHFVVLLLGCFPASVFLFQYFTKSKTIKDRSAFTVLMWILFWVVLLLFSIVKTKIVHYSSLCYLPLTYLAALQVAKFLRGEIVWNKAVRIVFLFVGVLWAIILIALPLIGIYKAAITPFIQDPFAVANLQADVPWHYAEMGIGLCYAALLIAVVVFFKRKKAQKGWWLLVLTQIVFITLVMVHFTPKIEAYSQRAAIDFFESKQNTDAYILPLGYKSYAHLFYAKKRSSSHPQAHDQDWLLHGSVDKPTFFICKIQNAAGYRDMPQLQEIGAKNGFVFFSRKPTVH